MAKAKTGEPDPKARADDTLAGSPDMPEPDARSGPGAVEPPTDAEDQSSAHPEPVAPAPGTTTIVKRGGVLPTILGGVIAAAIGAGATIYALPMLPPGWLPGWLSGPGQDPVIDEMTTMLATQSKQIEALTSELNRLKSAPLPAPDLSGVQTLIDRIGAEARANKQAVSALQDKIAAWPAAMGEGAAQASVEAAARAAQERIEAQARKLRDQSEAAARAAMAQAAVVRVKAALDSGAPLASALADLQAAGASTPDALRGNIASLQKLQADFPQAARQALGAARKADAGHTIGNRLGAFLLSQAGARSLTPKEGNGPDAVLSRAQAKLDSGDLKAALAEIATLPEAAQTPLADWKSAARKRVAALDALTQLGQR